VVIGGGVAGLASAALLAREGYAVELLEKNDAPGGRAGRWDVDGFHFDTGPSWYLMPEVFDHFFALLGTTAAEHLDLVALDPAYRIFFEDQPAVDVRSGREEVTALFEELEPGSGPRLAAYLGSAQETYDLAVRRFLYTTYESLVPLARPDVLLRLGRLARLLLQPLDRFVGRSFRDRRLRQLLGYPAVFLGTSPGRAPSMYHLMSHLDLVDGVRYPMGGFSTLTDALVRVAEQQGVRIRLGATATRIQTVGTAGAGRRRARVRAVHYTDGDGTERSAPADVVVGATDLHHVEHDLLPESLRSHSARWWRGRDPGPGAVLVMLGVRGQLPGLAHHSLFFTRDWDAHFEAIHRGSPSIPDPASIYVCRPSATDASVAPPGDENLFVLVPVPASPELGRGGVDGSGDAWVERVADAAVAQVAAWAEVPDLAERITVRRTVGPQDFVTDVNAWSGGALGMAHTLRQSALLRGRASSRKVAGLHYAGHSALPGIGLPMCLISAEVVLKAVRGDRSTGPLSEPLADRRRGAEDRAEPTDRARSAR
jgi:phytoene desaturase